MWDPDPLAATDAELHVTAWADELRADEANRAACAAERHHYQDWLDLADELNDADAEAELDWFDVDCVAAAQAQAATYDLPWPPGVGDYDRWCANEFPGAKRS